MIIVNLKGGLGNQMFEYAAGRSLALKHNVELKLDLTFLLDRNPNLNITFRDYDLDIFPNISVQVASQDEIQKRKSYLNRTFGLKVFNQLNAKPTFFREKKFSFHEDFNELGKDIYLDGYWQSEKYFKSIETVIRKDFLFAPLSIEKCRVLAEELRSRNSVCINVRRGDFVEDEANNRHGFAGLEYIRKAVDLISNRVSNPYFYIFSDDIKWCEENLSLAFPTFIADHSYAGNKFGEYLHLMSLCQHFIIPNSSFAWWAAWLCTNQNKIVIAPQKWFNQGPQDTQDLLPESWIRL